MNETLTFAGVLLFGALLLNAHLAARRWKREAIRYRDLWMEAVGTRPSRRKQLRIERPSPGLPYGAQLLRDRAR